MKKILLVLLLIFLAFLDAFTYAHEIKNEISQNVIRLHIVANDNSIESQNLKLEVRDAILSYMSKQNLKSKDEALYALSQSLDQLEKIAASTLYSNGCTSPVKAELGEFYFPTKKYDKLSFPSGKYTALKITIGVGKGENWWCVMYPALCFSETVCSSDQAALTLEKSLSPECFKIISQNAKFKFKILEFFK